MRQENSPVQDSADPRAGYAAGSAGPGDVVHVLDGSYAGMNITRDGNWGIGSNDIPYISDWREVLPDDLTAYAEELTAIQKDWGNWGLFRAASLEILADYCKKADLHGA